MIMPNENVKTGKLILNAEKRIKSLSIVFESIHIKALPDANAAVEMTINCAAVSVKMIDLEYPRNFLIFMISLILSI